MSPGRETGPQPQGPAPKSIPHRPALKRTRTVADYLARTHPGCGFHAAQTVERFRRAGSRRFGLWMDWTLDAPLGEVHPDDLAFLRACWSEWVEGGRPFARGGRRVSL